MMDDERTMMMNGRPSGPSSDQVQPAAIQSVANTLVSKSKSGAQFRMLSTPPAGGVPRSRRAYGDGAGLALAAHPLRFRAPFALRRLVRGLSERRLKRVTDYINENLAHDLTLAELAKVANLSPSHFKVLFKQSVEVPVHQYVIRCRVEHALELITDEKVPLTDVALRAGFANQSHMARWVRRATGLAPRDLRRSNT
jgi:AraC-like DNA-binding protein